MIKRLLLLNGICVIILAVHHATGYGFSAMFEWTNRYQPVTVPNYDQVGSFAFYTMVLIQQLDYFALPGFMFISGFFVSIVSGGREAKLRWDVVRSRVINLLIPFLIWTVVFFIVFVRRLPLNLDEIFDRYYYIPLLIQYYLLAPFIVRFAQKRPILLLVVAAALELSRFSVYYLVKLGIAFPGQEIIVSLTPRWLFPMLFFSFAFGLVAGFHRKSLGIWLPRLKWPLLATVVLVGTLTMVEYLTLTRLTGQQWLGPYFGGFTRQVYAMLFILCFLAFGVDATPLSKELTDLGGKSLGVYLVHNRLMFIAAVLMYELTPRVLQYQFFYQLVLIIVALVGSVLLMELVKRSPAKPLYRYLFG